MTKQTYAYFMSNFVTPNLIVNGPRGKWDLTATFAHIETGFGSKTECDEKEAQRRRAQKELLKLECVKYAISGEDNESDASPRATYWLLPPEHNYGQSYGLLHQWSDPEAYNEWLVATGKKTT